jgi:hypothetical protein
MTTRLLPYEKIERVIVRTGPLSMTKGRHDALKRPTIFR